MPCCGSVRDILVPLAEYPHVRDNASVRDAYAVLHAGFAQGRRFRHVLVLDTADRLVGLLGIRDLLRALFPDYLKDLSPLRHQGLDQQFPALSTLWQDDFANQSAAQAAKPVKLHVGPVRATVAIDDPVSKAAYLMVTTDSSMLPVTDGQRVVGTVRIIDVFNEAWKAVSGE